MAAKLTSSSTRSRTVCSRRAPIFSIAALISAAMLAIAAMPSSVNSRRDAFGRQQRHILLDETGLRLGQDAAEIVSAQRLELDPDRQPPLQFRQQVGRLGEMEGARGDEQDVVGLDRPVLGRNGGALDQRQEIALHALAADIGALALGAGANLVDLVEEHDAVVLDRIDRLLHDLLLIEQLVAFLRQQYLVAGLDAHAPRLGAACRRPCPACRRD